MSTDFGVAGDNSEPTEAWLELGYHVLSPASSRVTKYPKMGY